MSTHGRACSASVPDPSIMEKRREESGAAGHAPRSRNVIPFATLAQLNEENEPPIELKCDACGGDGVLPIYDWRGKQCGTCKCPVCGGTRYAG